MFACPQGPPSGQDVRCLAYRIAPPFGGAIFCWSNNWIGLVSVNDHRRQAWRARAGLSPLRVAELREQHLRASMI